MITPEPHRMRPYRQPVMGRREWAVFLAVLALAILAGIIVAILVADYVKNLEHQVESTPLLLYEPSTLIPNETVEMHVILANAPSYNPQRPYFGTGGMYVVVNYLSDEGDLQQILHYAEVTPISSTGVDVCQTKLIFDDFYTVSPTNGATNASRNVTYASESYAAPFMDNLPGGSHCSLRAGVEALYEIMLCGERDGVLAQPSRLPDGSTLVDSWDYCEPSLFHGRFPS